MEPTVLSDGRVLLRSWEPADVPALVAACQDADIVRWTAVPSPYLEEHAEAFVTSTPGAWAAGVPRFGVFDAGGGELLGAHGIVGRPEPDVYEIGFWVAAPARGRGVAAAATRLVAAFAFDRLGAARVEWQAEVGNWPSRRVAERVGFTVEGTLRGRLRHAGEHVDGWIGGLLPGELR